MPLNCAPSDIELNIVPTCDDELTKGVEEEYFVGQLRQLANPVLRDATNKVIIRSITLKAGQKLKRYAGFGLSTKPSYTSLRTDFGVKYPQRFEIVIASQRPEVKKEIMALSNATDLFFIYKNKGTGGQWEEMGIVNGMSSEPLTNNKVEDSAGATVMPFVNPDARLVPSTIIHLDEDELDVTSTYLASLALALV